MYTAITMSATIAITISAHGETVGSSSGERSRSLC
jgi:hypothetical protein